MIKSYRKQFFEWVNKQPVYQDMTLQIKEMTLDFVDCWRNHKQAYIHYARLCGREFAIRCATDFCWFIKNQIISDLQHQLKKTDKALELACIEELREIGIYNDDLDYKKEMLISKQQYLEQAEKEVEGKEK